MEMCVCMFLWDFTSIELMLISLKRHTRTLQSSTHLTDTINAT
jgi:hypothetical protein